MSHQCVRVLQTWGQSFAKCMGRASQSQSTMCYDVQQPSRRRDRDAEGPNDRAGRARCMVIHDDFDITQQHFPSLLDPCRCC